MTTNQAQGEAHFSIIDRCLNMSATQAIPKAGNGNTENKGSVHKFRGLSEDKQEHINQMHPCHIRQGLISSWKVFVPNSFFPLMCLLILFSDAFSHMCCQHLGTPVTVHFLQELSLDICPRATCDTGSIRRGKGLQSPDSHSQQLSSWPDNKLKAVHKIL